MALFCESCLAVIAAGGVPGRACQSCPQPPRHKYIACQMCKQVFVEGQEHGCKAPLPWPEDVYNLEEICGRAVPVRS